VGVSRDCRIFGGTPIMSGMGKATNFKFCTHIHSINRKKSPLIGLYVCLFNRSRPVRSYLRHIRSISFSLDICLGLTMKSNEIYNKIRIINSSKYKIKTSLVLATAVVA